MDLFFRLCNSFSRCRKVYFLLSILWIAGLLSGATTALFADNLLIPTMRAALYGGLSIFGLLAALLLPLFITAFVVYISQPLILLPISFCKAFSFAFIAAGLLLSFGNADWLLCLLFMFANLLALSVLWWCWLHVMTGERIPALQTSLIAGVLTVLVGCVDFVLVAPFLADLL